MSGSGGSEVRTPIFSGENYEFWRIKMMTIFKSHGLWNLVEKGFKTSDSEKKKAEESSEDDVDGKMAAVLMQDAKALGIIQNAVSDQIFPRIANAESSKMAWDLLYGEYHGGDQVRSVKLQNLRREFEYSRMRDDETLSGYLTRLNDLINQMKTFGEILPNARLVQKVLISLSKPYDPICLVIENTKNIETVELQEILAILKSQEQRFDMHTVDAADKAFASFSVSSKGQQNRGNSQSSGQKSQKNWNPKGKPWESKGKPNQNSSASYNSFNSSQPANQEAVKPQCKFRGDTAYFDYVDKDRLSMVEVDYMVQELGYLEGIILYNYKLPGHSNFLTLLWYDEDVVDMCALVLEFKEIEIYLEHLDCDVEDLP
ncbi:hypothetical protein L3X38_040740 [Prunus dulcis]|uniref:PB1-like domain-containing protein n=1 Tax=Prunus dulcis TaxID=3755 RepID=A0AAD4UMW5_PRUDU|nr:hypothetical protein L3X38_040740 [Prunus dulcis]